MMGAYQNDSFEADVLVVIHPDGDAGFILEISEYQTLNLMSVSEFILVHFVQMKVPRLPVPKRFNF